MSDDGAPLEIGPSVDAADRAWLESLWHKVWGGDVMVSAGRVLRLADVEALIARAGGERLGAATYAIDGEACELTSLNALAWRRQRPAGQRRSGRPLSRLPSPVARHH